MGYHPGEYTYFKVSRLRWLVAVIVVATLWAGQQGWINIKMPQDPRLSQEALEMRQRLSGKWVSTTDSSLVWEFVGDSILVQNGQASRISFRFSKMRAPGWQAQVRFTPTGLLHVQADAESEGWPGKPLIIIFERMKAD